MNIQLKDLKNVLLCRGILLNRRDVPEEWRARVSDFEELKEMYVTEIYACDDNLVLTIQKESTD